MRVINKILSGFDLKLSRVKLNDRPPAGFTERYQKQFTELKKNSNGFKLFDTVKWEGGHHPESYVDVECNFASSQICRIAPESILDIGSYRRFLIGLMAHFKVTTIDIRERTAYLKNENCVTGNAINLSFPDNQFDLVLALCSIANFGMGRYGDDFDMDADRKAINEMIRVIKPGGRLIFTTSITRAEPFIFFNSHKTYSYEMIKNFCRGMVCEEESFFNMQLARVCSFDEITNKNPQWSLYCGCWKKL